MQEPFLTAYKKVLYDALFSRGMDEASIKALLQYLDYNSDTISDVNSRVQTLENNETIYQLYEFVGQSTSGTVTVPTEGEIYDLYQDGVVDAIAVAADENNRPTTTIQTDSNGQEINVLTLTENGSYTLNAIPVSNTCLLYWIKIQDQYKSNVDESKIIPPILPLGDDTENIKGYVITTNTELPEGNSNSVITTIGVILKLPLTPYNNDRLSIVNDSGGKCTLDGNGKFIYDTEIFEFYDGESISLVFLNDKWNAV